MALGGYLNTAKQPVSLGARNFEERQQLYSMQ
jgi:hypothetical protein